MLSLLFLSHSYSLDLYNDNLQTTTVFFTRNFTQGWLNSNYSSSAFSCPFIVQHKQSNERSRSSRIPSGPHYCLWTYYCFCVVDTLLFVRSSHLSILFFSHSYCWCFTWNVFDIFVSAYLLCIKWYFIVSIFLTLFNSCVFDIRQY